MFLSFYLGNGLPFSCLSVNKYLFVYLLLCYELTYRRKLPESLVFISG